MNWIQSNERCPICSAHLWKWDDYMENIMLLESEEECRNCKNYFYRFETGVNKMVIGRQEFVWAYNTPDEEYQKIVADIDGEIDLLKRSKIAS